jgi:hypothetical protein
MLKVVPIAIALAVTPLCLGPAQAVPPVAHGLAAPANVEPVAYVRGPRGGAAVRGPRGGVAVRGPGGGVAVRGPGGGVAARGAYRVGGRYYGGVWYGHVRRFYGGRWWPYGVGSCWARSPIGYVWVCG